MSDRKRAIETLKQLRLDYEEFYEEHNNEVTQAYDMAISSLETDEAYQIMYEGGEIFTKADMVAMLEELKEQLREMHEDFFETEHFDEAYGVSDSIDVIQQKIDALKEDKQ